MDEKLLKMGWEEFSGEGYYLAIDVGNKKAVERVIEHFKLIKEGYK